MYFISFIISLYLYLSTLALLCVSEVLFVSIQICFIQLFILTALFYFTPLIFLPSSFTFFICPVLFRSTFSFCSFLHCTSLFLCWHFILFFLLFHLCSLFMSHSIVSVSVLFYCTLYFILFYFYIVLSSTLFYH